MSTLDADLTALLDALALEADHLEQLNGLLLEEAAALRRLDRARLEALTSRIEACVLAHLEIAKRRDDALRGLLPDAASPSLSMVVGRGLDPSGRAASLLIQLRGLHDHPLIHYYYTKRFMTCNHACCGVRTMI